jgi:thymidylate synthase (FAD)
MSLEQIIVQVNPDSLPSGSDLTAVNAARKSFGKRSNWDIVTTNDVKYDYETNRMVGDVTHELKLKPKDKRLIEFLARGMTADDFSGFLDKVDASGGADFIDKGLLVELLWTWRNTPEHTSPFGHCFLSFEIKVPMFLARQLVKHKFLRWSEYSRRYITDDVEFYEHEYRESVEDKKQGSGGTHKDTKHWQKQATIANQRQLELYNSMIEAGVAPEQARGVLPADLMTAVTWSGSLDAFAEMCKLRLGSDAQKEAQFVAKEVYKVLKEHYPVSAKCLVEGVL